MEMLSVPIIAIIVFSIIELLKIPFKKNKQFMSILPMLSGILGGLLGIVAFYSTPQIIPVDNVFNAFIAGLLSGLSATGSHQIVKQILNQKNTKDE